ncbi:MAG: arginine--tRNA ligase, partial [Clostridia bacterium]|nr:arginine--tRNA ligase [Clostridia bacterium]
MKILQELETSLKQAFKKLGIDNKVVVTFSNRPEICDFQCNSSFEIAKKLQKSPVEIANLIVENLGIKDDYEISVLNGFINFTLTNKKLKEIANNLLNHENFGFEKLSNGETIMIDYGGPNVAKPLHVGHLRSAIIGETIKRLALFMGYNVIGDVHLGDWGLQMGLTIAGLEEKFDLGYFFGEDKPLPNITFDDLNEVYPMASKRSKEDDEFKELAQSYTVKLQNHEKGYYDVWKFIRNLSIKAIEGDYKKLNIEFDLWEGESTAENYVKPLLKELEDKNLIVESEGAKIVEVAKEDDKEPMPPVIVVSSKGAQLYHTTDCATILQRYKEYNPKAIWYFTDNRQALHFKQVFRLMRKAELCNEVELEHYSFGTMNGKDGKPFKTREGGVMKLSDLISMLEDSAKRKLEENGVENTNNLALDIGVSALKFGDMFNSREKNYVFDLDKFASFDGKTGPYILYSIVRLKSILEKCKEDNKCNFNEFSKIEKDILICILKMIYDFESALKEKAPSYICASVYNLANSLNTFYAQNRIISEENKDKKEHYLSIINLAVKYLEICCNILAIN